MIKVTRQVSMYMSAYLQQSNKRKPLRFLLISFVSTSQELVYKNTQITQTHTVTVRADLPSAPVLFTATELNQTTLTLLYYKDLYI